MDEVKCEWQHCNQPALEDSGLCALHAAEERPPVARVLTTDESSRLRREQASSTGPKTIDICAEPFCSNRARQGPWCGYHRPGAGARLVADYDDEALATVRERVDADAAVLFVIAMDWITRQRASQLGVDAPALTEGIERLRAELATTETHPS